MRKPALADVDSTGCPTPMKTPPLSPQRKDDLDDANGDKDSSGTSGDVAAATNTSTTIGGRLTFYKGKQFNGLASDGFAVRCRLAGLGIRSETTSNIVFF